MKTLFGVARAFPGVACVAIGRALFGRKAGEVDWGPGFLLILLMALCGGAAFRLIRPARGLLTKSLEKKLRHDPRRPVLVLRPFAEDRRIVVEQRFPLGEYSGQRIDFEETIEERLSACGPVVAIGSPGDWLPPSGASRLYVPRGGDWQKAVGNLLNQARLVVMIIGHRRDVDDGLSWEVDQLFNFPHPERVVFITPQLSDEEVETHWNKYVVRSGGKMPPFQPGTVMATFGPDWSAQVTTVSKRATWEYRATLAQLAEHTGKLPGPLNYIPLIGAIAGGAGAFVGFAFWQLAAEFNQHDSAKGMLIISMAAIVPSLTETATRSHCAA